MAPGAIINGMLSLEITANFGERATLTDQTGDIGLLVSCVVTIRFELDLGYIYNVYIAL